MEQMNIISGFEAEYFYNRPGNRTTSAWKSTAFVKIMTWTMLLFLSLVGCKNAPDKSIRVELGSPSYFWADNTRQRLAGVDFLEPQWHEYGPLIICDSDGVSIDALFRLLEYSHASIFSTFIETDGQYLPFRRDPIDNLPFWEFEQMTNSLLRVFIRTDGVHVGDDSVDIEALRSIFADKLAAGRVVLEIYPAIGTPLQSTVKVVRALVALGGKDLFLVFGLSDENCTPAGLHQVRRR